jgi:hypothetical protein
MTSKAGHREYLLSSRVSKAGIGIARARGKTYVAWAFSSEPPDPLDCPVYKAKHHKGKGLKLFRVGRVWRTPLRIAGSLAIALGIGLMFAGGQGLTVPILLVIAGGVMWLLTRQ